MCRRRELWALSHLAKLGDGHFIDDFIHCYTLPFTPFVPAICHSSLAFPDRGESFSFTGRNDIKIPYPNTQPNGARFTPIQQLLRHPERWLVQRIPVTKQQEEECYRYCWSELGKTYGYGALVAGFLFHYGTDGKKSNYCSRGGLMWPLHHIGIVPVKYKVISPRRANLRLEQLGFKTEEVTRLV